MSGRDCESEESYASAEESELSDGAEEHCGFTSSSSDASSVSRQPGRGSIYDFFEAPEGGGEDEGDDDGTCPPCDDDDADADGEHAEAAADLADSAQLTVQNFLDAARRARAARATYLRA